MQIYTLSSAVRPKRIPPNGMAGELACTSVPLAIMLARMLSLNGKCQYSLMDAELIHTMRVASLNILQDYQLTPVVLS